MKKPPSKNTKDIYGAVGTTSLLSFDPDTLKIVTNKKHHLYDPCGEQEPNAELVASILYKGVTTPILVWKDPETGDVCVVDGRQRVLAARAANKVLKKRGEPIK